MTEQEYYNDSEAYGSYSYVTLEQIVNDYLANRDQDDYTSNTPRYKVVYQAKRALRELYYDVLKEVRAIEMSLPSTLYITLPPDYVNYTRISWLDDDNNLHPMTSNTSLRISEVYLQDSDDQLVFDNDGNIIRTCELMNSSKGSGNLSKYNFCGEGFAPNSNPANVYKDGSFRVDSEAGVIRFSSEAEYRNIVIEYVSDGLYGDDESDIRVHKFAEQAVSDRIYYHLIARRRTVPANEKARAKREYFNSRRTAKRRINSSNKEEWIKAMRGNNVWIKG